MVRRFANFLHTIILFNFFIIINLGSHNLHKKIRLGLPTEVLIILFNFFIIINLRSHNLHEEIRLELPIGIQTSALNMTAASL